MVEGEGSNDQVRSRENDFKEASGPQIEVLEPVEASSGHFQDLGVGVHPDHPRLRPHQEAPFSHCARPDP